MALERQPEHVQTREEFVIFVRDLHSQLIANDEHWENATLESYLSALAAWAEDLPGWLKNQGLTESQPSWELFAHMLLAATLYE